jgi:hypothetical protein
MVLRGISTRDLAAQTGFAPGTISNAIAGLNRSKKTRDSIEKALRIQAWPKSRKAK